MIRIHYAQGGEIADAEALWAHTFPGDDGAFQRDFYRLCAPDGPLVLTEDGDLRAMLVLPEFGLRLGEGWTGRAGYVYALATAPAHRGDGWASMLLETAAGLARNRGLDCLITVPAKPPLFRFFARNGFAPGFYCRELTAQPVPAPVEELAPEGYAELRETLLAGRAHTTYTPNQLAFQRRIMCPRPGSGLYRLELAHGPGCAAVENRPGDPVVKELLCAPGDEGQGAAACAALCGGPVKARVPAGAEDGTPFGAVRWLHGKPPARWADRPEGWLGLAFD